MPITPFLNGANFDPETRRVLGIAYEMTCTALGLADRSDLANGVVAQEIIALAQSGECDPNRLCETALQNLRSR
jgi:hypothetical protein